MEGLRYAALAAPVENLGPGRRVALWVQGCPLGCPECTAPDWQASSGGRVEDVTRVAHRILARGREHGLDGLTLSGGEPLLQAPALLALWERVLRERPEWTLVLFTGFREREIRRDLSPEASQLLDKADLAITGRYVSTLNDGRGLRGSSNQRLLVRRPDWVQLRGELEGGARSVEVHFSRGDGIAVGVPPLAPLPPPPAE